MLLFIHSHLFILLFLSRGFVQSLRMVLLFGGEGAEEFLIQVSINQKKVSRAMTFSKGP